MDNNNNLGTATWLSPEIVARKHPYETGRIWAGRQPLSHDAFASKGLAIGFKDDRHVLLVGGNRSGKGTTFIVPNLCLWPGSVLVLDPKGENAMLTAARRGRGSDDVRGMGQPTYVLDPYKQARGTEDYRARFNPLEELLDRQTGLPVPDVLDQVMLVVEAIVVDNDTGAADPFWNSAAREVLKTVILHVLTDDGYEGYRNLVTVRRLLTLGDVELVEWMKGAGKTDIPSPEEALWRAASTNPAFGGIIAGVANRYLNDLKNNYKTYASVMQNVSVHTAFMDSDGLRESLRGSDFRLEDLKNDPDGISIFLCMPQRYMMTHYRWMRIVTNLATAEMERVSHQPKSGHRVLFMLDEFAVLRRLEAIESAVSYIAGFGVKMAFVLQSLDQLKRVYPNAWETFYANCALRIFMGVEDNFTKDYISKAAGDTEVVLYNKTSSNTQTTGQSNSRGGSRTVTRGQTRGTSRGGSRGTSRGGSTSQNFGGSETFGENEGFSTGTSSTTGGGQSQVAGKPGFFGWLRGDKFAWKDDVTFSNNHSNSQSNGQTGGTSRSRGTSWGKTNGTNWGENEGTNWSENQSVSLSEALGETWGTTESTSEAYSEGMSEARQKRPLVAPDEIGRYFSRVEPEHKAYPGLALLMMSGENPAPVRRTNYFEDLAFVGLFTPHPDYPLPVRPQAPALPEPPLPPLPVPRLNWAGILARMLPLLVWGLIAYQWIVWVSFAWYIHHNPFCVLDSCPPLGAWRIIEPLPYPAVLVGPAVTLHPLPLIGTLLVSLAFDVALLRGLRWMTSRVRQGDKRDKTLDAI